MRVGHVVVAGEVGGAERMLVDLARSDETEAEHRLFVFTPSRDLLALFRNASLTLTERGLVRENPLAFAWQQLGPRDTSWLAREMRRAAIDVVHLHTLGSQVLGTRAARALKLPVIRTEHSTRVYEDKSAWPFSRWSLRRVSLAVAVSTHVRDVAIAKAPWANIRVVHNGVDVDRFAPASAALDRKLTLLFLGRLEPRKGADLVLRALAKSRAKEAHLLIAGTGPDRAALTSFTKELGLAERVTFLGHVDDPKTVIGRTHAIVCASRKEGLGIAFLEAMAMGRPVVGLATGGVAEFASDENAFVATGAWDAAADTARVDAVAAAIDRASASRDELQRRGARARERVVSDFSRAAMARAYGEIYRSVNVRR